MTEAVQEREMSVGLSFTAPLSLAQWVQDYMRSKDVSRAEVIVRALELLRASEQEAQAA